MSVTTVAGAGTPQKSPASPASGCWPTSGADVAATLACGVVVVVAAVFNHWKVGAVELAALAGDDPAAVPIGNGGAVYAPVPLAKGAGTVK